MTAINFLHLLLGGGLVAFGMLASAAAGRLGRQLARDADIDRQLAAYERPARRHRAQVRTATPEEAEIIGVEVIRKPAPRAAAHPVVKPPIVVDADAALAKDVAAALVGAGYSKRQAADAVAACPAADRGSAESWMVAALRRCARGAA